MRLVYKVGGHEVKVGDRVNTGRGEVVEVKHYREPHKPSSEGKVYVKSVEDGWGQEYYVSVIGAEWIEREDRAGW